MKAKQSSLLNGFLALLLILATFLPSLGNVAYAEDQELQNGTYEISFNVHKNGSNEISVMDDYTEKPAVLTVEDGSYSIDMTLTQSHWYEDLTIEGSRPEVVEDLEENKRIVRYSISDLEAKVNAWVHIIVTGIPGFEYDNKYDVQIAFDQSTLTPLQLEEEPVVEEPVTEEPVEEPVVEEPITEEPVEEEPVVEEPVTEEPLEGEPVVEEPVTEEPVEGEPVVEEPTKLEDGTYNVAFSTKHATEDRDSTMSRYLISPVLVDVENGKASLQLTTKESNLITDLQLESNGEFKQGETIEEDLDANTRTYEFELDELRSETQAKVSMRVPMGNGQVYENTQSFRMLFDLEQAEKQPEPEKEEPEEEQEQKLIELEEGKYSISFEAKHAIEDQPSSMGEYLTNPTSLVVEDGISTLTLTTKDRHLITDMQLLTDDVFTSGTVVEEGNDNTRTYSYSFEELQQEIPAKVSMRVPLGNGQYYENTREFRLIMDEDSVETVNEEPIPETPETPEVPDANDEEHEDGQYEVDFTVYKNGSTEPSVMDGYTEKPATVVIKNGKYMVDLTLTNSEWYQGLTINEEEPKVVSEDSEANKRIVQFEVNGLEEKIDAWVHIVVTGMPGFEYDNEYDVQIAFDSSSLTLIEEPEEPKPVTPKPEEPQPEEPKPEQPKPEQPKPEGPSPEAPNPQQPGPNPPSPEETPGEPQNDELEDGQYEIGFSVLKNGTSETSVMDQYTEKPATVYVKNGEYNVDLTLTNSSWYKNLVINDLKPTVVSEDKEIDKRTVRFETQDLSEKVNAKVHIVVEDIPGFEYDHKYDVQIVLDVDTLKLIKAAEQPPTPLEPENPDDNDDNDDNDKPDPSPNNKPNDDADKNDQDKDKNKDKDLDELADGRYEIDFSVYKDGTDEISVMDQYTEKPATVYVKDKQFTVDLTLTNSEWYEDFTIQESRPEVISEDTEEGKRVVRFKTDDLEEKVEAWVHIIVPAIGYDNEYDVQLAFNPESLTLTDSDELPPTPIKVVPSTNVSNKKNNNQPDPLSYARGNHSDGGDLNASQAPRYGQETNAKTSESSILWVYGLLVLLSVGYFTWKYVRKRTVQ